MASEDERNDVSLCFQALGIEFGAPPDEVEKAYKKMVAEINKKQSSTNPAVRAEAAKDLELARDLYEKIRGSVTYNTKLRDTEKLASTKAQHKKEAVQQFKICPSCNKTISITLKKCPYCRELILSPFENFINSLLSLKTVVILTALIALIAGIAYLIKPDLFNRSTPPPPPVSIDSFSNISSIYENFSGVTQNQ